MNTKNNNDKPHFNVADVIIIVALVAVIAAFGLRIYNIFGTSDEEQKVRIEFEVNGISAENISLKKDAKLYYAGDNSLVGTLEEFEITDTVTYAYNENGELVKAVVPGKKTVTGTIVLKCTKTEKGFYLGGTRLLSAGDVITMYTKTREMNFRFIKITEIEKDENGNEIVYTSSSASTTAATVAPEPQS